MPDDDVRSDVSPGTESGPVTNTKTILQVATLADDGTGADLGTHAKRDLPANVHTIVKPPGGCASWRRPARRRPRARSERSRLAGRDSLDGFAQGSRAPQRGSSTRSPVAGKRISVAVAEGTPAEHRPGRRTLQGCRHHHDDREHANGSQRDRRGRERSRERDGPVRARGGRRNDRKLETTSETVTELRRQSVALLDNNALGAATEDEEWLDDVASAEIDTTGGPTDGSTTSKSRNGSSCRCWLQQEMSPPRG